MFSTDTHNEPTLNETNETFRTGSSPQPPPNQQELQLQEEEDIQMAIAISLNEQENKVTFIYILFFRPKNYL